MKAVNGTQNWIETFYEIVSHLETTCDFSGSMSHTTREQGGRTALYTLAEALTNEFEKRYFVTHGVSNGKGTVVRYDNYWHDHDYPETIEAFLKEKETEHFKSLHR